MTKKELTADIKAYTGSGLITRKQLASYVGVADPHNVDKYLKGLSAVNGKFFFIGDVVDVLLESTTRKGGANA